MMISRPLPPVHANLYSHDGGDTALHPLRYQGDVHSSGGYPAPIIRTKSYAFRPGFLPPVNKVSGPPRLYG